MTRIDRPIVLVGMMGAGKSTVGTRLARRLDLPFVDTDIEVERAAGRPIRDIVEDFGEPAFREGERRVIRRLMGDDPTIMATGGGSFMDEETRTLILEQGIAVWLKADLEELVDRTSRRNNRPDLEKGDPREILKDMIEVQTPKYAQAHISVHSSSAPHRVVVDRILDQLDEYIDAGIGGWVR